MSIPPRGEGIPGCALDPLASLLNHSCDPNAFFFSEAGELRFRSLRSLSAGDEITISYTDVTVDVGGRRAELESKYFFACSCMSKQSSNMYTTLITLRHPGNKCESDMRNYAHMVSSNPVQLKAIEEVQNQLSNLVHRTKLTYNEDARTLQDVEAKIKDLTPKAFPDRIWPEHLQPMPAILQRLGQGYKHLGMLEEGLKFSLRGCLSVCRQGEPEWVGQMFSVLEIFSRIPKDEDLTHVFLGYLSELALNSRRVHGEDSAYTIAIQKWFLDAHKATGEPHMGGPAFSKRFKSGQSNLLKWASIAETKGVILTQQ